MKIFVVIFASFIANVYGVTVDVDTRAAPDLANFGRRVKANLEDWYPRVVRLLQSPTFSSVARIPIYFDPNYNAIAYAQGGRIVGSVRYYRSNQNDVGSMIHEMVHVIQQYRRCPSWITEGIADWVRYYHFEPNRMPRKPGRDKHYTRGYEVSAYFLNWMNRRWNGIIYRLNKDCREGTYQDSIFTQLSGKTVDQLWNEMLR